MNIFCSIVLHRLFLFQDALLFHGDAFDLQRCVLGQTAHLHGTPCGEGLCEVLAVDLIHLGKIIHVCKEDRGLHYICQCHALLGKDGLNVLEGLCGLGRDALGDGPGSGVDGELAGDVDRLACCDALRIWYNKNRRTPNP